MMPAGTAFRGNCDGSTFEIWGVLEGEVSVSAENSQSTLPAISWTLLPAALGEFTIEASGESTLLRAYVG